MPDWFHAVDAGFFAGFGCYGNLLESFLRRNNKEDANVFGQSNL
jgi:hypothetical protein